MGKPSTKGFSRNTYVSARQSETADEAKFDLGQVEKELKPLLVGIVERAFRRYVKAHGVTSEVEEREWTRFKKILNGML
jgi:hypothetical protein